MKPVDYVNRINESYQSMGYPPYQWSINDAAPLAKLKKPLSECTVSMLTSGGISYRHAEPFEPAAKNNFRLDEIDPGTSADGFQINDAYYDYRDGEKDIRWSACANWPPTVSSAPSRTDCGAASWAVSTNAGRSSRMQRHALPMRCSATGLTPSSWCLLDRWIIRP
jgi:hypothetical protein